MNSINKIIVMILVIIIHGCPKVDHFIIENNSNIKVRVLSVEDITSKTEKFISNGYIEVNSLGFFMTVNESVEMYFERNPEIELYIMEFISNENYKEVMRNKSYHILGRMRLTNAKLDSLGGKVSFPLDFELVD